MQNAYYYALQDMFSLMVPDFMGQHGYQFMYCVFFYQRIKQSDPLVAAKSGKKAFDLLERLEPSIMKTFLIGKLTERA